MAKTRKGFDDIVTLIALFAFIVVALNSFTSFDLSNWLIGTVMILAGAGLMLEGKIMTISKWAKNGIQQGEMVYLFTVAFGLITLVGGFLKLPLFEIYVNTGFNFVMGIVAVISAVIIGLQRWVWN